MKKTKFDERQLLVRGNIFKHMFLILFSMLLLNIFLTEYGFIWADNFHANFIIILLAIAAGSIEMIFREVYNQRNGSQNMAAILIGISSGICIISSITDLFQGEKLIENGQLTGLGGSFAMQILPFSIFIAFIIKKLNNSRDRQED